MCSFGRMENICTICTFLRIFCLLRYTKINNYPMFFCFVVEKIAGFNISMINI